MNKIGFYKLLFLFLFCLSTISNGQDSLRNARVGVSYLSEGGLYPGFAFSYEKTLLGNGKFQMLLGAKTGAYFHYRNHTGIFLMLQSGQRFRIHKRFYFEHFLGVGYLHSFLNGGDAYFVDATGRVKKSHNYGNPHFMPSASIGLSYEININNRPVLISGRPLVFWQIPFNRSSLVQYAFEIAVLVQLRK